MSKLISIVTPCYNEEGNVEELSFRIKKVMGNLNYRYEHIFIDNASADQTVDKIKKLIEADKKIKLIVNVRNFGHLRSPYHAIHQAHGDAVILMASDLQDPPELIPELINKWEYGYKTALIVKKQSMENPLMFLIRKFYYKFLNKISEIKLVENAHGSGLYDRLVIGQMAKVNDPNPYLRGLLAEIGYPIAEVEFTQPRRKQGITKNNFFTLLDTAIIGIINHSMLPIRMLTIVGFILSFLSIAIAVAFFILKMIYWERYANGMAPLLIGLFFFVSIQLFFLGLIGEYVSSINIKIRNLPMVVESERVNFE